MKTRTGLKIEDWNEDWTAYEGAQSELIETGLFCLEWFPGQPGNGKTSSTFVFTDDTKRNGYIKHRKDGKPRENGYGRACITGCGPQKRRAYIYHPPAEVAHRKLQRETRTDAEAWQLAKEARTDKAGALSRWRNAISHRITEIEKLCAGEAYFSEMPDVRIKGGDLARVHDAVENLRRTFALTTPAMPDVVIRSNVFSIRDGAHRGLKKTG